jgi:hypothetical protein
VIEGLETVIASATATSAASLRNVGIGNVGSRQIQEGNPSIVTSTTIRSFAGIDALASPREPATKNRVKHDATIKPIIFMGLGL